MPSPSSSRLPPRLVADLLRPAAWPGGGAVPEFVETHISWLFLVGERVYKVKKPVDLGFLDLTDPERRRELCHVEVRLNRRLAPDVYLGVVPITADPDGRARLGGEGRVLEHAVEMVRLPAAGMMDRLLEAGEVDNERLHALADRLLEFHRQAERGPAIDRFGSPEAVATNARENLAQLAPFAGSPGESAGSEHVLSAGLLALLGERTETGLAALGPLLARRVAEGRVCDGHGDLHAGNICFAPHPVAYDCLEFADRFRCADVACDLAFLTMDLDRRGYRGFSDHLARHYAERAGDPELLELLPFYETYRALVRAKVRALRAAEGGDDAAAALAEARRAVHLAAAYHLPPVLVITCGLPASGKSTGAVELARPFEARVHHAAVTQEHLAAEAPALDPELGWETVHGEEREDELYRALAHKAVARLEAGEPVVVDATFARRAWRRAFTDASSRIGRPVLVVWYDAPPERVLQRLARRDGDAAAARELLRAAQAGFDPPYEVDDEHLVVTDSLEPPERVTGRLLDRIAALGPR